MRKNTLRSRNTSFIKRRAIPVVSLNNQLNRYVHHNFLSSGQNLSFDRQSGSIGDDGFIERLSKISDSLLDQAVSSGIADGRLFTPSSITVTPAVKSGAVSLGSRNHWRLGDIGFQRPSSVLTCIRRKRRKEVLFALGVAGQRGRKKKPRWNRFSYVRC